MGIFLATFLMMIIVLAVMAVGVIFGRHAIKGSCGGTGNCICEKKCDKRKKLEAEQAALAETEEVNSPHPHKHFQIKQIPEN